METNMNYQYFGLFLDEQTRNKLLQVIISNPIIANLVFQRGNTLYLDHCTLLHSSQRDEEIYNMLNKRVDETGWSEKEYDMEVNRIGFSKNAIAFGVTVLSLPCANPKPHITVCTFKNGRPSDSNEICEWISIPKMDIKGTLLKIH